MPRPKKWSSETERVQAHRDKQASIVGTVKALHQALIEATARGETITFFAGAVVGETPAQTLAHLLDAIAGRESIP